VTVLSPRRATAAASSSPSPNNREWRAVAREVAADRAGRLVFAVTTLLVGLGYSLLLPFASTQRISFANWDYLDARYVLFSVAFALGLGWLVTLQVHAARRIASNAAGDQPAGRTGPLGAFAAVISVLPSLLCCSPILPTLIGLIGLSATTRLTTTVQLQHFFATKENLLLAGALGLLLLSGLWSMRKLSRATCLTDECCIPAPFHPSPGRQTQTSLPTRDDSPTASGSQR
jgi:hypothetical protein